MTSCSRTYRLALEEAVRRGLELPSPDEWGRPENLLTFREFIDHVRPRYKWYRHCVVLANVLQKVADGQIKRLMIFMPPRDGKSEQVSRLFAPYFLYRYPDRWVGLNSYGAELAYTLSRAARENYQRFGGLVKDDASAVKNWETLEGGGLWAAGVGGAITGRGFSLGIIDDPLKNAEEAASETIREKQKEWYGSTFYTREDPTDSGDTGQPSGAIIIVQTRWNEDDLSGWLLSQESSDEEPERWHIVCFEAIKEQESQSFPPTCTVEPDWRSPGEALCPERRPVEKLRRIASKITDYFFGALFQQRPRPATGHKFKKAWFRHWKFEGGGVFIRLLDEERKPSKLVKISDCRRFGTVDLAASLKTSADYTVIASWAVTPDSDLILLDLMRDRIEAPDFLKMAMAIYSEHDLAYLAVEANGMQLGSVQALRRNGIPTRGVTSQVDKLSRATTAIVRFEAGQVYLPERASWLPEYERELLTFPNDKHDDQVDVTSLAAIDVFKKGGSPIEPDEVKHAKAQADAAAALQAQDEWQSIENEHLWQS
jgi:predicted phage terminase large subunit-like protein